MHARDFRKLLSGVCALSSFFSADADGRTLRLPMEASGRLDAGQAHLSRKWQRGPNMILNRSRGEAGYKSIARPNDDHHFEHIFSARCCVDVWLS